MHNTPPPRVGVLPCATLTWPTTHDGGEYGEYQGLLAVIDWVSFRHAEHVVSPLLPRWDKSSGSGAEKRGASVVVVVVIKALFSVPCRPTHPSLDHIGLHGMVVRRLCVD